MLRGKEAGREAESCWGIRRQVGRKSHAGA